MNENEKERIDASIQKESSRIYAAKKLSKWFTIYFRIQMFGKTILEKEWPSFLLSEGGEK